MSEALPKNRFPDEEPDFGDPDFHDHYDDPYGPDGTSIGPMNQDKLFDKLNPDEAKRIEDEVGKKHIDPTNQNQDIRTKRLPRG